MHTSGEVWWELFDDTHDRNYYYNTSTEQTVWTRPSTGTIIIPEIEDDESDSEDRKDSEEYIDVHTDDLGVDSSFPDEDTTLTDRSDLSLSLKEVEDLSEVNSRVDVLHTAKIPPPVSPSVLARMSHMVAGSRQTLPPPQRAALEEGWEEFYDEPSNSYFFLHKETKERTYDRDVACGLIPMVDISEDQFDESDDPSHSLSTEIPREYPSLSQASLRLETPSEAVEIIPNVGILPAAHAISDVIPPAFEKKKADLKKSTSKHKVKRSRAQTTLESGNINQEVPSFPSQLQDDINMFQLVGFAEQYFETHKRGIFRRQVPVKEMLCWTKLTIPTALTRLPSSAAKEAVKNFKAIQMYSGDRPSKNQSLPLALDIVGRGINRPELRDEIYCQLCKQSCYNPDEDSNHKVWELFVISSFYFPPSRNLEKWLTSYMQEHLKLEGQQDDKLAIFAKYVLKKLQQIIKAGPRGRLPTAREIERNRNAPFSKSVFGVTLEDVMELQVEEFPDLEVPRVVIVLSDTVRRLEGFAVEGIFRVPGDTEQVHALRLQLDNGNYDITIDDPNTPASLLKLWLRELEEPLVPVDIYDECISSCIEDENNSEGALANLQRLPPVNRATALFVIKFLKEVATFEETNKMSVSNLAMVFAPNFLRCPSEDPQVIFNNTKHEQSWLRALMMGV